MEGRGKEFVVVGSPAGEKAGKPYDEVAKETPFILLSPDGSKIAYQARRGENERFIVVGHLFGDLPMRQVEGPVCDEVWQPIISRGELAHPLVCYGARIGRELWWKVVDADYADRKP